MWYNWRHWTTSMRVYSNALKYINIECVLNMVLSCFYFYTMRKCICVKIKWALIHLCLHPLMFYLQQQFNQKNSKYFQTMHNETHMLIIKLFGKIFFVFLKFKDFPLSQ